MRGYNKYGAKRSKRAGVTYHSKAEARYHDRLVALQKAGQVAFWLEQVPMRMNGGTKYLLDFLEFWNTATPGVYELRWVDVKSAATFKDAAFRIKRREIESLYGIDILCLDSTGRSLDGGELPEG